MNKLQTEDKSKSVFSIDEYLKRLDDCVRERVIDLRAKIHEIVPEAEDSMGYGVLAVRYRGKVLLYYAGFKKHVGLYPNSDAIEKFRDELTHYPTSKGTIRFPLHEEMPWKLLEKIIRHNMRSIL